jgi:toxin ParE1/3/4
MADLVTIAEYTLDTWGHDQVDRYLTSLEECFLQLANSPGMGRKCDKLRPGYSRLEHAKHVIFYRLEPGGIIIIRILHQRMLPRPHLLGEDVPLPDPQDR